MKNYRNLNDRDLRKAIERYRDRIKKTAISLAFLAFFYDQDAIQEKSGVGLPEGKVPSFKLLGKIIVIFKSL